MEGATMPRFDGTAARRLDFGDITTTAMLTRAGKSRSGLRLAVPATAGNGPDKYRLLEHRLRQAQIAARHLLDVAEDADASRL
jgi:hypothetical protein